MKKYVLGFAFSEDKKAVVLILKDKPDWQKGKWNGVGGKVELSDQSNAQAMVREFYEETGVQTELTDWKRFAELDFPEAEVFCFKMFSNAIKDCSTCESEVVDLCSVKNVFKRNLVDNLHVLIRLALQSEFSYTILMQ